MTVDHDHRHTPSEDEQEPGRRRHGRWMMIACCVPLLAIALIIALSGAGLGFLIVAIMCTAMMALMMGGMSHGGSDDRR
jgi:Flp pilus assembly protein TadB